MAANSHNELGEGTLWDEKQERLWWVDIYGKQLLCFDPHTRAHTSYELPAVVGTVVIGDDGRPLLAQGCDVSSFDTTTKELVPFAAVEPGTKTHRLNDGKCDPWGRLWVGSMVEEGEPGTASLFCVTADKRVTRLLTGVTISNGLVWANEGRLFYYIDTPTQQVVVYDCDLERLTLSNRRVVFEFPSEMGSPDGMTIDAEGQLWVALFGGRSVVRLDPARGELTGRVHVGAKNVTSCAFGGPKLNTLYISTGRLATSPEELEQLPDAGALFEVELTVRGTTPYRFRRTP